VHHPLETIPNAAGEKLSTPDASVVAISSAIETDADHALVPALPLGQHGSNVRMMMLDRALLRANFARPMCSRKPPPGGSAQ
jgi:hypothetical protein